MLGKWVSGVIWPCRPWTPRPQQQCDRSDGLESQQGRRRAGIRMLHSRRRSFSLGFLRHFFPAGGGRRPGEIRSFRDVTRMKRSWGVCQGLPSDGFSPILARQMRQTMMADLEVKRARSSQVLPQIWLFSLAIPDKLPAGFEMANRAIPPKAKDESFRPLEQA